MTEPTFIVREAALSDLPALARHRAFMFRDMGQLKPGREAPLIDATSSYLHQAMPGGDYLAWVAEETATRGVIVGGAGVQLRPILPRLHPGTTDLELGPEALVVNVYVEPEWRRRGVALALMQTLLRALSERGIRRIVLHASDEGRALYERLGFTATNEMRLRQK